LFASDIGPEILCKLIMVASRKHEKSHNVPFPSSWKDREDRKEERECLVLNDKLKSCETTGEVFLRISMDMRTFCKILGFQGCDYEECRLLGCYAVWCL
jgi:hypothetical protein